MADPISLDWECVPEGWRPTDARAQGWNHPSIVERQRHLWAIYSELIRGTGPLAFRFYTKGAITPNDEGAHNFFMTFAYVLARAAHHRDSLAILDWGGGVGYYALMAQRLLPELALDYVIKELAGLAGLGRELMPWVRFETDEAVCFSRRYDLVLASSSIQYAQDWQALLTRLAAAARDWLFITRVPIVRRARSFVVVQRPHDYGYLTEYISWIINRNELLGHVEGLGLTLEREFIAGGRAKIHNAPEESETLGFLFRPVAARDT